MTPQYLGLVQGGLGVASSNCNTLSIGLHFSTQHIELNAKDVAMQVEFSGRRVVVAGGSRGIGRSIAVAFAEAGAAVSICARGAAALETTRAEMAAFGNTVHAARCDLSQLAEIERYMAEAGTAPGGIDILVNNATGSGLGDIEEGWNASLSVKPAGGSARQPSGATVAGEWGICCHHQHRLQRQRGA
jgi:hypothetical protein